MRTMVESRWASCAKEDMMEEGTIYLVLSLLSIIVLDNVIKCSKEVFHSVVF